MKNILVPTDYSENARNAAEYAIQLAKATGASIEFLHVFPEPEITANLPVNENFIELIKKEKSKINKEAQVFSAKNGVEIKTQVLPGILHEVLKKIMFEHAADLVVAGINGVNVMDRYKWGKTITQLIKNASFPLLIVPSKFKFKPIKHITIAADFRSLLDEKSLLILKVLNTVFNGKLQSVHVKDHSEEYAYTVEKSQSERYFESAFNGLNYTYSSIEAENITSGLVNFIESNHADLVVMIPLQQNSWQSMFVGSNTRKMAYQTDIPLLILPA